MRSCDSSSLGEMDVRWPWSWGDPEQARPANGVSVAGPHALLEGGDAGQACPVRGLQDKNLEGEAESQPSGGQWAQNRRQTPQKQGSDDCPSPQKLGSSACPSLTSKILALPLTTVKLWTGSLPLPRLHLL